MRKPRVTQVLYTRWRDYAADHHDISNQSAYYIQVNDRRAQETRRLRRQRDQQPTTRVIFRMWEGSVIALFPDDKWGYDGNTVGSYMHVGQHGGANYRAIMHTSRPATSDEYAALKRELENGPYWYHLDVTTDHS